jgi:hypothetical protein
MSGCPFGVGDRVGRAGLCGTVVAASPGGILVVDLDGGGQVEWPCDSSVGPCQPALHLPTAAAAVAAGVVRCGAPLVGGGSCRRRVAGGGRCYQHRD